MSPSKVSKSAINKARKLRSNMTESEERLWKELKNWKRQFGLHIRRQVPIGKYVADFAIHEKKLVIEVDGEFHYTKKGLAKDKIRDAWLSERDYRILRLSTGELEENFDGCVEEVMREAGLL